MEKLYCVYKLISPCGSVYVGITSNLKRRFSDYKYMICINQIALLRSIKKHGWEKFEKEILFSELCKKDAVKIEIELIKKYKNLKISLNMADGGESGPIYYGGDNGHSKPIIQCDLNGNVLKEWSTIAEAAKNLNSNQTCLGTIVRRKYFYHKGYFWISKEDYENGIRPKMPNVRRNATVLQIGLDGKIINEFQSVKHIRENFNTKGTAKHFVSGWGKSGYIWMFKDDYNQIKQQILAEATPKTVCA